jgi:predicted double-glycine peptidase
VRRILLLLCWLGLLLFSAEARPETEYPFRLDGARVYKHVANWKELRDKDVVKQKFDYSCGSGALATLMWIGFGDKVSEAEIIKLILGDKSEAEIKDIEKNGYSLLDLKQVAEKMGYTTAMYKLQLVHLRQLQGPVLIYIEHHGLKHFAVFKALKGDRVYLADPARGNTRMSTYRFENEWPGYILAIDKK